MKRCRISAVHATLVLWAAIGVSVLAPMTRPAQAAVLFSNYTGVAESFFYNELLGTSGGFWAAGFTLGPTDIPSQPYYFLGAAAFVLNADIPNGEAQPFSMALYAGPPVGDGAPSNPLWTSGTLYAPGPLGTATLVSVNLPHPLFGVSMLPGREYFFVLDFPSQLVGGFADGSKTVPFYASTDGTSWTPFDDGIQSGVGQPEFKIFGAPVPQVPEPAPWAMLLLGFAGLGFVASRRERKYPVSPVE